MIGTGDTHFPIATPGMPLAINPAPAAEGFELARKITVGYFRPLCILHQTCVGLHFRVCGTSVDSVNRASQIRHPRVSHSSREILECRASAQAHMEQESGGSARR